MLALALTLAVPVAVVAALVVHADANRRDLPATTRRRWTVGVATATLAGFLVAFGLEGALASGYAAVAGTPVVLAHPRQLVATLFAVGLAISGAAFVAYGVRTRYGRFGAPGGSADASGP